jgi:hypothetical protein
MRSLRNGAVLVLAAAMLAASAGAAAAKSNKWRLEFSGTARSAGTIVLEFTPPAGEPLQATIEIAAGTSENMVAKAVVVQLRAQATGGRIAVERDDGEDVLIKKKRGQPDFAVAVASNTVEGVRIDVERE